MNRAWLGIRFVALLALLLVLALTQGDDPPATSTTLMAAPTSTAPPTTTTAPTTTVPTTTPAPTTTHDLTAREAEVEALVKELEFEMIEALYDGDRTQLASVVAGEALWNTLQPFIENPGSIFSSRPTKEDLRIELLRIPQDREDCLVVDIEEDPTAFLNENGFVERLTIIMWPNPESGTWQLAERFGIIPESEWSSWCGVVDRSWSP